MIYKCYDNLTNNGPTIISRKLEWKVVWKGEGEATWCQEGVV